MNENVRDFFNQVAVNYSHDDSQLIDDLLDSLFVTRCHRILDLGCGKGIISEKLASRNNGEVVALDLSSEMLTLQGWHQRLGVDFGLEEVDADEHQRQDGREREYPLVLPAGIDDDARQRQEEGIPEARFAHRP